MRVKPQYRAALSNLGQASRCAKPYGVTYNGAFRIATVATVEYVDEIKPHYYGTSSWSEPFVEYFQANEVRFLLYGQ